MDETADLLSDPSLSPQSGSNDITDASSKKLSVPDESAGIDYFTGSAKFVILLTAFVDTLGFSIPNPILPFFYDKLPGFSETDGTWCMLICVFAYSHL